MASLPALPNATEGTPLNSWLEEPAKKIGALIQVALAFLGLVLALGNEIVELLPESVRREVTAAIAIITTIVMLLVRIQAVLTRNRVFSPGAVEAIDPAALNGHADSL